MHLSIARPANKPIEWSLEDPSTKGHNPKNLCMGIGFGTVYKIYLGKEVGKKLYKKKKKKGSTT